MLSIHARINSADVLAAKHPCRKSRLPAGVFCSKQAV
jgi:hypothetical protein